MADLIGKTQNNYGINVTPIVNKQTANSPKKTAESEKREQISELSHVTDDSMVKVPMSYVKTGEIELPYKLKAYCYKMANGQRVVILPKEGETVLRTYVNTGSMNEPDNVRGISHYIEHNLFNGSEGLGEGEFFATTNKMGASTNASTGFAETNYYISSHLLNEGDLEKKIKLHASMIETPKFATDMLEKEKGVVNSEINMITSNPENEIFNETLKDLFNIKTSSSDVIAGTTANITALKRDDVVDYFNQNYYPANMVTVVSGEIKPEETIKLLSKHFSSIKQPPQSRYIEKFEPIQKTVRKDTYSNKTKSAYVALGFAGPENNNIKDRILLSALTKRMFKAAEAEEQFKELNSNIFFEAEKIGSNPSSPRASIIMGDVNEENSEKLLKLIYSRIQKYQTQLPTEKEMKNLKRDLKRGFEDVFESSFAVNDLIGSELLTNNSAYITEYTKIVDEMTPQDIQNTAKKYFPLDKTVIRVMHSKPVTQEELNKNYDDLYSNKKLTFTGARKQDAVNLDNVKKYKLPNNYIVVTNNIKYPTSLLNIIYSTKQDLNEQPAKYYILEEMLNNGTMKRTIKEFNEAAHDDGIGLSIGVIKHGLDINAAFESVDMDKALGYVEEILTAPRLTQEDFDKTVIKLRDSLLREESSPDDKLMPELLNSPDRNREEILKSLDTITLEDIKNLYARLCNETSASVVLSANFTDNPKLEEKFLGRMSAYSQKHPLSGGLEQKYKPQKTSKVFTKTANKNQAKIIMAYKFKNGENLKDEATLEILNTILGGGPSSRLFNDLREKQKLAYAVSSNYTSDQDIGIIKLRIKTTTDNKETKEKSFDNVQKSIDGFKYHIDKLVKEEVSEEELEAAKLVVKNSLLDEKESTANQTVDLNVMLTNPYGLSAKNKLLEEIDKITAKDIQTAAKNIFKGNPVYSIVATEDTINANREYLQSLGELS